ncbi:flagellar basal body-associated FliL family protein [Roseospirillum parvum]|uniref:Flagellar protein FliL n=1 Tax=Roseospirillum parvum TaxID=83401 RepID=A0A1G8FG05_9PROT|nr:flagellar basal body-associated FliL family protein [Roseospirillum parvum]SDH81035.1 flagellar FliL protein [Roseospirillum parvum]
MAEDVEEDFDEEPDEAGGSGGKGSRKKLLIFILIPVLLVVIGAAVAFFTGLADGLMGGGEEEPEAHGEAEAGGHAAPADDGHGGGGGGDDGHGGAAGGASGYVELSEMVVDLNASGRKRTFLKLRVSLELDNPGDAGAVEAELPRIVDSFQVYLRELRVEDLEGSAGMYRLKEELLRRVNMAVKPVHVKDVLFGEMLIQ